MTTTDAYAQLAALLDKFTQRTEVRHDLVVTALGTSRAVRLAIGDSPMLTGPDRNEPFAVVDRNVGTMRELAEALLTACDFVDAANPRWTGERRPHPKLVTIIDDIKPKGPTK